MKRLLIYAIILSCLSIAGYVWAGLYDMKMDLSMGISSSIGPASDALLLETSDYVLLETGDYLLLE